MHRALLYQPSAHAFNVSRGTVFTVGPADPLTLPRAQ
ncbi:hypothetical protein BUUB107078_15150 [Burkholderia ubonensis]|nr:hypothetical protein BUB20358_00374 [Burkholderia ubonensis]